MQIQFRPNKNWKEADYAVIENDEEPNKELHMDVHPYHIPILHMEWTPAELYLREYRYPYGLVIVNETAPADNDPIPFTGQPKVRKRYGKVEIPKDGEWPTNVKFIITEEWFNYIKELIKKSKEKGGETNEMEELIKILEEEGMEPSYIEELIRILEEKGVEPGYIEELIGKFMHYDGELKRILKEKGVDSTYLEKLKGKLKQS